MYHQAPLIQNPKPFKRHQNNRHNSIELTESQELRLINHKCFISSEAQNNIYNSQQSIQNYNSSEEMEHINELSLEDKKERLIEKIQSIVSNENKIRSRISSEDYSKDSYDQ